MSDKYFFDYVKKHLFNGLLYQSQVDGMNAILDGTKHLNGFHKAYVLATAYHETGKKMQPVEEIGKGKFYVYGKWQTDKDGKQYCFTSGSKKEIYFKEDNSNLYFGRGLVQLTWLDNYKTMSKELGIDLVNNPDLANDLKHSVDILVIGMVKGLFTGKTLDDFINSRKKDYYQARKIINGLDKAKDIATIATLFEKGLGL